MYALCHHPVGDAIGFLLTTIIRLPDAELCPNDTRPQQALHDLVAKDASKVLVGVCLLASRRGYARAAGRPAISRPSWLRVVLLCFALGVSAAHEFARDYIGPAFPNPRLPERAMQTPTTLAMPTRRPKSAAPSRPSAVVADRKNGRERPPLASLAQCLSASP